MMSVSTVTFDRVSFRPVGNLVRTVRSAIPSMAMLDSSMPANPFMPSDPAISTTRSRSLPAVITSSVASPPFSFGRLRKASFEGSPNTRASPRTSKCLRLAETRNSASRASAPSGRLVKVPFLTIASTSKSMACGFSLRRIGNAVRTVMSALPDATILVRSRPLEPPIPS